MNELIPEPSDLGGFVSAAVLLGLLVLCYFFGIWSRHYVLPARDGMKVRQQLVAGVPVALITMGIHAKSAAVTLTDPSDFAMMFGYAIIFGMLSRESLARILQGAQGNLAAPAPAGAANPV